MQKVFEHRCKVVERVGMMNLYYTLGCFAKQMPKTNHNRAFIDERDYSVPAGDWACGKQGARNQRRGAKKGVNGVNRTRQTQVTNKMANGDEDIMMPVEFQEINKAHDYNGKARYVRYPT